MGWSGADSDKSKARALAWSVREVIMDLQLKGKRALVTGASSGLGSAIALGLAEEGVSVVVHGRDRERADAVARDVAAKGVRSAVAIGDITKDDQANAIADTALAALGGIDIIVNSAGGVVRQGNPTWLAMSPDDWLMAFNFNVVSVVRLAQRLVPPMMDRGWGRLINISSVAGRTFGGLLHDYGAAKAAVDHITTNLSKTFAPRGVTVNAVVPGTMLTPASERWIVTLRKQKGWSEDFAENERRYTSEHRPQPVPRLGRPAEIAAAVTFLASPRSDYTTGATLLVDGGVVNGR
jgi:NAD(P)-dependent dehydrogenase (short-subunit alcohol dehydrogenase family)